MSNWMGGAGTLSPVSGIGIATFVGLAIMTSSIYQGRCAATAIQASAKQPAVFGKALAALAIVESFALFAFVSSPCSCSRRSATATTMCVTWEIELEG